MAEEDGQVAQQCRPGSDPGPGDSADLSLGPLALETLCSFAGLSFMGPQAF